MTRITNYCSQKFTWLSVDLEKLNTQSCCAATPTKIELEWVKDNPGKLFNTPTLIQERADMLRGIPVSSCSATCWKPESNNLPSRRLTMGSNLVTHTELNSTPKTLHIILSSNCNLTCVYCCKQYSTAWKQDIITKGPYDVSVDADRFTVNNLDRVLLKVGQKDISSSNSNKILLDEISKLTSASKTLDINITGGEPFLYLNLVELISKLPTHIPVNIWSGLGVNSKRFARELSAIKEFKNVNIVISAENINRAYEFTRYGNTWTEFETNLKLIQDCHIPYKFNATISNLTVFGLVDFFKYVGHTPVLFEQCNDPDYLSINVLDNVSKQLILETVDLLPAKLRNLITTAINQEASLEQETNFKKFVLDFANRRNLTLDCFPESLANWINK